MKEEEIMQNEEERQDEELKPKKELKYFNYSWHGDPTIDIMYIFMTLYISPISIKTKDNIMCCYPEYDVYVTFWMGNLEIGKTFHYSQELLDKVGNGDIEYQPTEARKFIDLISNVNLENLQTKSDILTDFTNSVEFGDHDKTKITFSYDMEEGSSICIEYPNNKELIRLCNDFFYKYLMQDKEIIKILENYVEQRSNTKNEMLEENSKILRILKYNEENIELDLSLKNYKLIDESAEENFDGSTNTENDGNHK